MTYEIHEDNMPRLEKKLTRIGNKCRKYGCEFRFEKTGEIYRDVFVCDENGRIIIGLDGDPVIVKARFVIVKVEGIAKLNDLLRLLNKPSLEILLTNVQMQKRLKFPNVTIISIQFVNIAIANVQERIHTLL